MSTPRSHRSSGKLLCRDWLYNRPAMHLGRAPFSCTGFALTPSPPASSPF